MRKTAHLIGAAFGLAALVLIQATPAAAQNYAAVAFVNDTAITNYDVDQRARLLASAGGRTAPDALRGAALDALIADTIKLDAAREEGITISAADIDAGFAEIASNNGRQPRDLFAYLQSRGVTREAMEAQIRAELAWGSYVQRIFRRQSSISEADVDAAVAQGLGQTGGNEPQYTLKQIVIRAATNAPQGEADAAMSLARATRAQVTAGPQPVCDAMDTLLATNGGGGTYHPISGDLGSVGLSGMPGPVRNAVAPLSSNMASEPVRSNDGFHIIAVCDLTSNGVDRESARAAMVEQKLNRFAKGLLQDLRRQAIIERR